MATHSVVALEAARTAVEAFRTRALRSVSRRELISYAYKRVPPTAGAPLPMPSPVSLSKSKGMLLARAALVPQPKTKKSSGEVENAGASSTAEASTTDTAPTTRKAKFVPPTSLSIANPFLPHKVPGSKFWTGPRISLRMQKKLVQAAKASGTLHLLPPGPKTPLLFAKDIRVEKNLLREDGIQVTPGKVASEAWASLPVTWTSESHEATVLKDMRLEVRAKESMVRAYSGRRVKFRKHVWERNLPKRGAHRKILMRDMARRVRRYKNHYKRKLPDPLKPVSSTKSRKLPF